MSRESPVTSSLTPSQLLLTGAMSGLLARVVTHPMDTVKARMQVQGAFTVQARAALLASEVGAYQAAAKPLPYASTADCIAKILSQEGLRGFYKGFGAVIAGVPLASAVYFGGYELAVSAVEPTLGSSASYVAAGLAAQAAAGLVFTPMDLIKERMQVQALQQGMGRPSFGYSSSRHAAATVLRAEGVKGLFRGYWTQNLVWWPWNIMYFVTYEHLRTAAAQSRGVAGAAQLPPHVSAGCATVAATLATLATSPIDVIKTRLQTLPAGSGGAFTVAAALLRTEGARALWAGTFARVLSIAPGSAISFYAYEALKRALWAPREG